MVAFCSYIPEKQYSPHCWTFIKCHNKLEKGDILEEKRRFSLEEKNIMFFMKQ